jgi:hypothetical protein
MFGRKFTRYLERRDAETRKRDEETRKRDEEFREFHREILLRNEKVYTSVIAEMEEARVEVREQTKQLAEGTLQIQANTQAVLSMLDRFNGSAP